MFQLPDLGAATPWSGLDKAPDRDGEFSFVLLSDRTGMAQPGVFERGVAVTNLLRPDFAIQIGDTIEGYTRDADELAAMWKEYDGITDGLQVPLFAVPGNHDLGNDLMRDTWLARHARWTTTSATATCCSSCSTRRTRRRPSPTCSGPSTRTRPRRCPPPCAPWSPTTASAPSRRCWPTCSGSGPRTRPPCSCC
ncbi:hypothetical protein BJF78_32580 [Pseudonocardia sp. CNS-139]|nr:hypothetical protein BJF78_32580 [Pseudonocardia sp. CNS-139]